MQNHAGLLTAHLHRYMLCQTSPPPKSLSIPVIMALNHHPKNKLSSEQGMCMGVSQGSCFSCMSPAIWVPRRGNLPSSFSQLVYPAHQLLPGGSLEYPEHLVTHSPSEFLSHFQQPPRHPLTPRPLHADSTLIMSLAPLRHSCQHFPLLSVGCHRVADSITCGTLYM